MGHPRRSRFKHAHKDPKLSADYSLDFLKVFPTMELLENDLKDSRLSLTNVFISWKQIEDMIDTAVNFWEEDIIPKRFGR